MMMTAAQNITVLDFVAQHLSDGEPRTLPQMLASLSGLSYVPQDDESLRLLLRLDRRMHPLGDGRWVLADVEQSEARIVACAQAYFECVPGGGVTLPGLVAKVVAETHYSEATVRSIIMKRFVNNGKTVRNQLKERH